MATKEKNKDIIQMILNICKKFQVLSVAEGVEEKDDYLFLKENGCDIIQGYYFSKPLPVDAITKLIEEELL